MTEDLRWVGEFNWEQLRTGLISVKGELGKVRDYTKTVTIEGERLSGVMNNLGKSFIAAGAIAGGIFAGILAAAPALAPHLKRIEFLINRIFKTIAPYIAPFLRFLGDVLQKFADWIARSPAVADGIAKIVVAALTLGAAAAAGIALKSFWDGLIGIVDLGKWLIANTIKIAVKATELAVTAIQTLLENLKWLKDNPSIKMGLVIGAGVLTALYLLKEIIDFWKENRPLEGTPFGQEAIETRGYLLGQRLSKAMAGEGLGMEVTPGIGAFVATKTGRQGDYIVNNNINVEGSVLTDEKLLELINKYTMNVFNLGRK